ncbi:trimethylamine---corrinoid protein Co-methyltransferase [Desulforhopalus singaporensis]|uniref:Trimethylamine---corrinoid protein Co-methyltransferase n=1 Tax=Desulforhopalus singaporensis TaxID=91360 RepID=A0A1H0KCB7_9BACT|nr:trimethylamine---corrinoid protein Co-methyltransferase [Desulforhopalus singaporensis]
MTGLLTALAGANLIYGLGMLESGVTFDYGQLVMDNEFARMIKHTVNGIPVTEETLAVDVIKKVGPFNQFITEKHTFEHMKKMSQPMLIDRRVRDKWQKAGGLTMHEKAAEKARDILKNHKPTPLPDDVRARMRSIVEDAEAETREEKERKARDKAVVN